MVLQSALGLSAFAAGGDGGGKNLPNVTNYGVYSFDPSSNLESTTIAQGTVVTTGNDGATYTSPPWTPLTNVPYDFKSNVGIGIKFAVNVIPDANWTANQACFHMYDASKKPVVINVKRAGTVYDGSNQNRNYIFVVPQGQLQPGSTYTIDIDSTLKSNNGQVAGKQQEISFTTSPGQSTDTIAPDWTSDSLTASNIGQTSLTLSWSGATDNKAVTGYKVYQGTTLLTSTPVTGTSYNVTGLTAATEYTFKVQAGDAAGNWSTNGPSKTVTTLAETTSDTAAPTWPAASSLNESGVTQTGLTLSWSAATDNTAVTSYKVYKNGSLLGTATKTSYNVTGLNAATQYTFKVEAGDAAGNWSTNGPSKTVTTLTGTSSDSAAPTWLATSSLNASGVTQTGLTLSWSAATDNTAVTGYKVYKNGSLLGTATGTSYNVTGLNAATQYTFKVEAGDAAGNWSTNGPSKTVTTLAETGTSSDTKAPTWPPYSSFCFRVSNLTSNSLTLNWNAASDNTTVTEYRVYQGLTLLGAVNTTSFKVTGLNPGTRYLFKVEAGDAAGNWSTNGPCIIVKTPSTKFMTPHWQFRVWKTFVQFPDCHFNHAHRY